MSERDQNFWQNKANSLSFEGRALIDGDMVDSASGDTFACHSPIDGRLLTQVASCDSADADRAVAAARAQFNKGSWSQLPPAVRKRSCSSLPTSLMPIETSWHY